MRTLALRAILLVTTWVAAGLGDVPLAAHQVAATVWTFLVFALDALAIAAQALTGKALGAGDVPAARSATDDHGALGRLGRCRARASRSWRSTPSSRRRSPTTRRCGRSLAAALVVVALGQPLSGYVFVVDGVLIGAGDGRVARQGHGRSRSCSTSRSPSGCTPRPGRCSATAGPRARRAR